MLSERPVDERVVHRLWLAGALPRERYQPALQLARDDEFWRRWGERTVLALASGHLLAAILFFFAFNWQDLSPFTKLAALQGGVVGVALASRLSMLPELVRETLLIAATVLVGVLLAVFGQIFQTGADAWQLFAGWAVLTLPWVLSGRSAGHWLVWMVVVQAAIGTFIDRLHWFHYNHNASAALILLALPALGLLIGRELLVGRCDWLRPGWARLVPLTVALGLLFFSAEIAVLDAAAGWAILLFVVTMAAAAILYGYWQHDFAAVALMVLAACGFLATVALRFLAFHDEVANFYLAALEISLIFGAGSWLLRRIHRSWTGAGHD